MLAKAFFKWPSHQTELSAGKFQNGIPLSLILRSYTVYRKILQFFSVCSVFKKNVSKLKWAQNFCALCMHNSLFQCTFYSCICKNVAKQVKHIHWKALFEKLVIKSVDNLKPCVEMEGNIVFGSGE